MSEDEVLEEEEMTEEGEIDLDGDLELGDAELLEEDAFGAFSVREIE